ncbi:MAG: hypothetical protein COB07_00515 [Sulfurovum sp.]|nr:MAG: hypothetical protein COB07_00515 [Sulfurovum sp.]
MKQTKTLIATTAIVTGFLLSACTPSALSTSSPSMPSGGDAYIYNGVNFGSDRNADFKQGVRDACRTADGDYTKNHNKFNNNQSYKIGWEDGRLQCKGR